MKACAQALDEGKSVVIDNTNPSADVRAEYLAQAKVRTICHAYLRHISIALPSYAPLLLPPMLSRNEGYRRDASTSPRRRMWRSI